MTASITPHGERTVRSACNAWGTWRITRPPGDVVILMPLLVTQPDLEQLVAAVGQWHGCGVMRDLAGTARRAPAGAGCTARFSPRHADSLEHRHASNDYLGLPRIPMWWRRATACAPGAGATGTRLVSGHTALHAESNRPCRSCRGPSALHFPGLPCEPAAITALTDEDTLLLSGRVQPPRVDHRCLPVVPGADHGLPERRFSRPARHP